MAGNDCICAPAFFYGLQSVVLTSTHMLRCAEALRLAARKDACIPVAAARFVSSLICVQRLGQDESTIAGDRGLQVKAKSLVKCTFKRRAFGDIVRHGHGTSQRHTSVIRDIPLQTQVLRNNLLTPTWRTMQNLLPRCHIYDIATIQSRQHESQH